MPGERDMIATFIKNMELTQAKGDQRLYHLDPPLDGHEYVVSSAIVVPYSGPETYVFPANSDGAITNWTELSCSARGELDPEAAIRRAGYEIERGES
jgi:hypothetical protein